ncbi:MAG: aminopeptidase P family protein [Solobacterium sp.]|jgi:Xaa-Pro aminopeptidase|nr:aminopeptidase P family protein [Solobacterium sp.]
MVSVNERIAQLRKLMHQKKIDVYYVPNEDDHLSEEYTAEYFQCKSFLSGFTGDAGCLIVTKNFAGLWTDGRYFTQAEGELAGTEVTLMRLRQAGVPDPLDYLIAHTPKNGVLGFDGRVVSAAVARKLADALSAKNAKLHMSDDLAGLVWGNERPAMPEEKLFVLPEKYTGESAAERIGRVREAMKAQKADVLVLTELEDPCWMLNVRGNDIACTPVAYAFAIVTRTKVYYYVDLVKVPAAVKKHLEKAGVTIRPYSMVSKDLAGLKKKVIWADLNRLNASFYAKLDASDTVLNAPSPIRMFRAVKNPVEVRNTLNAHVRDGVAMVRFICWLKENAGKIPMDEVSVQNKLYELRAEGKNYIEPSFETICAYRGNAAMMHYTAHDDVNAKISPNGFLLVDSGGTYYDGTTDITRTISLGKTTREERMYYTKVLQCHLDLARAKFLHGTTGNNLDILAREPLWNMNIDFQCGTGHGVGHVLSVHEGPQGIRWGMPTLARPSAVLEEGMVVTDEPGVYLPHKLGIRIENELLVVKDENNFYGQFLRFESLTFCPYDLESIEASLLTDDELKQLNAYHKMVYETLSPLLPAKEKSWLRKATRAVKR